MSHGTMAAGLEPDVTLAGIYPSAEILKEIRAQRRWFVFFMAAATLQIPAAIFTAQGWLDWSLHLGSAALGFWFARFAYRKARGLIPELVATLMLEGAAEAKADIDDKRAKAEWN